MTLAAMKYNAFLMHREEERKKNGEAVKQAGGGRSEGTYTTPSRAAGTQTDDVGSHEESLG